jgi:voltage-gated potassium channel
VSIRASRNGSLSDRRRRRRTLLGVLRSLATTIVLVVLYYELPLDHVRNVPVTLVVGVVILAVVTVLQLRVIGRSAFPAVRAIEALATTVPLFLLLFASAYVIMADANPANFSTHPLTRTDGLYFTVTVFSTVGFGDITAASQSARLVVTVQMLLDLAALGLVVRAFVSAVQSAKEQAAPDAQPQRDDDAGLRLAFEDPLRGAGGEAPAVGRADEGVVPFPHAERAQREGRRDVARTGVVADRQVVGDARGVVVVDDGDVRPAVVLVGEEDYATPVAMSQTLAETIPDADLRVLPTTKHMSMIENRDAWEATLAHLEKAAAS